MRSVVLFPDSVGPLSSGDSVSLTYTVDAETAEVVEAWIETSHVPGVEVPCKVVTEAGP